MQHQRVSKQEVRRVQEQLIWGSRLGEDFLQYARKILQPRQYESVVEERSLEGKCGYPLCENTVALQTAKPAKFAVVRGAGRVVSPLESHSFCSDACRIASRVFASHLEDTPAALRDVSGEDGTRPLYPLVSHGRARPLAVLQQHPLPIIERGSCTLPSKSDDSKSPNHAGEHDQKEKKEDAAIRRSLHAVVAKAQEEHKRRQKSAITKPNGTKRSTGSLSKGPLSSPMEHPKEWIQWRMEQRPRTRMISIEEAQSANARIQQAKAPSPKKTSTGTLPPYIVAWDVLSSWCSPRTLSYLSASKGKSDTHEKTPSPRNTRRKPKDTRSHPEGEENRVACVDSVQTVSACLDAAEDGTLMMKIVPDTEEHQFVTIPVDSINPDAPRRAHVSRKIAEALPEVYRAFKMDASTGVEQEMFALVATFDLGEPAHKLKRVHWLLISLCLLHWVGHSGRVPLVVDALSADSGALLGHYLERKGLTLEEWTVVCSALSSSM